MTNFANRALQIVQSEEYLTEADLDLIRRYKRQTDTMTQFMVNQQSQNLFTNSDASLIELLDTAISMVSESQRTTFCSIFNGYILNGNFFSVLQSQANFACDKSG